MVFASICEHASSAFIFASTSSDQFPQGRTIWLFLWLWEPAGGRGLEDFSVARIFFYPLTNKGNIFFSSRQGQYLFGDYLPQDFFFHSNKEWDSPTYYKQQNSSVTQRFNGLHRFHTKKTTQVPAEVTNTCFNRRNEPLYEHTKEEGIQIVCRAYETFYVNKSTIPTTLLKQSQRLLIPVRLKNYLQIYGSHHLLKWSWAGVSFIVS